MKAMEEFHERVALARELDEVKQNLAKEAEGRLILMSEKNWFALAEPTCEFLLAHNGRVKGGLQLVGLLLGGRVQLWSARVYRYG